MMDGVFLQTGMVSGGWGYVIAAYTATWVVFLGYAASLWMRAREQQ